MSDISANTVLAVFTQMMGSCCVHQYVGHIKITPVNWMNDDEEHRGCTELWIEEMYIFDVDPYGSILKWEASIIPEKYWVMLVIVVVILVVYCKLVWWEFVLHIHGNLSLSCLQEWNMFSYISVCYWALLLWFASQKTEVIIVIAMRNKSHYCNVNPSIHSYILQRCQRCSGLWQSDCICDAALWCPW